MPIFNLDEINYIVTGTRQKILNFDFVGEGGEQKTNVSFFTDNEIGTYEPNNLSTTSFTFIIDSKRGERNTNEYGFVFLNDPTRVIRTLYDVKDVSLKSAVATQIGTKKAKDNQEDDGQIELYFPHLREDPLGFVQLKQYSYGMTDKTVIGPVVKRTDIYEKREGILSNENDINIGKTDWKFFLNPYDRYGSEWYDPGQIPNLIPTYLYTPLSNLQSIVFDELSGEYQTMLNNPELSANTLSSIEEMTKYYTSSYYSFLGFFKERGSDCLSSLFKPVYNFENIKYNYIVELPMVDTGKLVNPDNQYSHAIVNADMIMGKNVFDDIYDTNTSAVGEYRRVREYQGIHAVGNKLFLTYFDDREYTPNRFQTLSTDLNYKYYDSHGTKNVEEVEEDSAKYQEKTRDYQKIECVDAINRFISTTVHKANLYSTRVYGLGKVLDDKEKYSEETKARIKQDIGNSIRRIVTNFVPAHTQYFDVVRFDDLHNWEEQFC